MWTLRRRLKLADAPRGDEWRPPVESCVREAGDEKELDLDKLRHEVRAEIARGGEAKLSEGSGKVQGRGGEAKLSEAAAAVEGIIQEWERTRDDKEFAMRTRFFPSGVKIPGVKWTD